MTSCLHYTMSITASEKQKGTYCCSDLHVYDFSGSLQVGMDLAGQGGLVTSLKFVWT